MAEPPNISDAEWRVMQVLWREAPLGAGEVIRRLEAATEWSPRTIKTLLRRLVDKGALTYDEDGNRYLYRPAVTRHACLRHASRSFVQRVFGGDTAMLVAHLIKQHRLSPDEIDSLRQILENKER